MTPQRRSLWFRDAAWGIIVFLLVALASFQAAANTLFITGDRDRFDLTRHFEYYHDPSGLLDIKDVESLAHAGKFTPKSGTVAEGYLDGAVWVRFCVQRRSSAPREWLLEVRPSVLDDVRLFIPAGDTYDVRYGGELRPFYSREIAYRNHVFRMQFATEPEQEFYLRVSTTSSMRIGADLWLPEQFGEAVTQENILDGIFFGAVLMLLLLAAVQWFRSPSPLYGLYWLYVVTFTVSYLSFRGYAQQFVAPESGTISDSVLNLGVPAAMIINAGLIYNLVEWPQRLRRAAFVFLTTCMVVGGLLIICNLLDVLAPIRMRYSLLISTVSGIVGMIVAGGAAIDKAPGARLYLLAFAPFMAVTMLFSAGAYGMWQHSLALNGYWQVATIIHAILMQYAVFARELNFRAEKERAEWRLGTLAEEMEQQRQFISLISHEIRTPLSIIDGAAQLLQLTGQGDQQLHAEKIRGAARRMSELLERCLTSDRVSTGDWKLQVAPVDIAGLLRNCAERAAQVSGRHTVRLEADDVPKNFACDGALVKVIIDNLLDNAIKYSPEGGEIVLSAWGGETGVLTLQVKDRGVGVPIDQVERIFERYYRVGEVKRVAGVGLGLFIVKRISELHGGSVSCTRRSSGGTTFTVELRAQ